MLELIKEGISAEFLLWDLAGCLVLIMLEATLTRRKGRPGGDPVYGRLLNFFEGVIGWKEARNPSLSETAVHPTV